MRIEFKKQQVRVSKFCKFCEDNGADYFETDEECGIWIMPKQYGGSLAAIRLRKDGHINFGSINGSCNNFESISSSAHYWKEEQDWYIKILTLFKKYKP